MTAEAKFACRVCRSASMRVQRTLEATVHYGREIQLQLISKLIRLTAIIYLANREQLNSSSLFIFFPSVLANLSRPWIHSGSCLVLITVWCPSLLLCAVSSPERHTLWPNFASEKCPKYHNEETRQWGQRPTPLLINMHHHTHLLSQLKW